jgi:YjzC-like protein
MTEKKLFNPGEKAPVSAQYEITGPRGGSTGEERTVVKGEPLPPTPEAGQHYRIADPTKHKGSK